MSDAIITRKCWKCQEVKPLSEFSRNKSRKCGLDYQCKKCVCQYGTRYQKTEKGKLVSKKAKNKYRQSLKGQIKESEYEQTQKVQTRRLQYKIAHADRLKATQKVNDAITCNRIPKPNIFKCRVCNNTAHDYHHHKGYAPEHWFDIIPVCRSCHIIIHKSNYKLQD